MKQDARVWQVAVLGGVLLFGVLSLDFPLSFPVVGCTLLRRSSGGNAC